MYPRFMTESLTAAVLAGRYISITTPALFTLFLSSTFLFPFSPCCLLPRVCCHLHFRAEPPFLCSMFNLHCLIYFFPLHFSCLAQTWCDDNFLLTCRIRSHRPCPILMKAVCILRTFQVFNSLS